MSQYCHDLASIWSTCGSRTQIASCKSMMIMLLSNGALTLCHWIYEWIQSTQDILIYKATHMRVYNTHTHMHSYMHTAHTHTLMFCFIRLRQFYTKYNVYNNINFRRPKGIFLCIFFRWPPFVLQYYATMHPTKTKRWSKKHTKVSAHSNKLRFRHRSIYINLIVGLSVCLFVCSFEIANLFRLKSERNETRHVGPLGTQEGSRPNGFLIFDL